MMKNKKMWFKFGILTFVFMCFGLSFSSAVNIKLHNAVTGSMVGSDAFNSSITGKMTYIHFADNGNDFGGFFYFSSLTGEVDLTETGNLTEITVKGHQPLSCRTQVEGFYYNAERGERLWPLDDNTKRIWNMDGLDMSGGIFYSCARSGYQDKLRQCQDGEESYNECIDAANEIFKSDGHGFYGSLSQSYNGHNFNLTIGVDYTGYKTSKFISILSGSDLVPTFVRLKNKYPVGFIYDYNGGIGLVGCRFTTSNKMNKLVEEFYDDKHGSMGEIFDYSGDNIVYKGDRGLGLECGDLSLENTMSRIVVEGVVGMNSDTEEQVAQFETVGNLSDTKMQYFATKTINHSTMMNYIKKKAELLCRGKWKSQGDPTIYGDKIICINNANNLDVYTGHTRIIKKGDVNIYPNNGGFYDIYLLNGDLRILEEDDDNKKVVFDKNGFIKDYTSVDDFKNHYTGGDYGVAAGSFIRGNFIINGKITSPEDPPQLKNKYFIYGKFTTKDSLSDLEKVFTWRCLDINATDGIPCPRGNDYWNASLVIIDQNYPSPMLQS